MGNTRRKVSNFKIFVKCEHTTSSGNLAQAHVGYKTSTLIFLIVFFNLISGPLQAMSRVPVVLLQKVDSDKVFRDIILRLLKILK